VGDAGGLTVGVRSSGGYTQAMNLLLRARTVMARRSWLFVGILGILTLSSCQRAQQYRIEPKKQTLTSEQDDGEAETRLHVLRWIEPRERFDLPILFVADESAEWNTLKDFWNEPPLYLGMPTIHLGLDLLPALTSLVAVEQHFAIKIKVPRGLPDPTPDFPRSNPPSYGKWKLGKALFFNAVLPTETGRKVCASCHMPDYRFADDIPQPKGSAYNTLSLVNAVYNKRQFWDGRVRTLEETLGSLPSKSEAGKSNAPDPHNWAGLVHELVNSKKYNADFLFVFGVEHPTQDTVAQALATYIRTLLSGDSLFDRTGVSGFRFQPKELSQAKLIGLLKDKVIAANFDEGEKTRSPETIAAMVAKGHALFYGKARCAECHSGPLFTDHDFHNIGIEARVAGTQTGHALHVPIGLKQTRYIGAYRTPSLRNLLKTGPYFHDGSRDTLLEVVKYFDSGVEEGPDRLARPLLDGDRPRRLGLSEEDRDSLAMFLRALEGTPLDPMVSKQ
jgi:cytochrome c peroxidase